MCLKNRCKSVRGEGACCVETQWVVVAVTLSVSFVHFLFNNYLSFADFDRGERIILTCVYRTVKNEERKSYPSRAEQLALVTSRRLALDYRVWTDTEPASITKISISV